MDPRPELISKRLESIGKVIAIAGGKGGVGKSSVASILSLQLAFEGKQVGLLDLDFCGPTAHLILGAKTSEFPKEDKGILPPTVAGIKLMSIAYYSSKANPLRGDELSGAIKEILAVTLWGNLDFLILDMPPGTSDTFLEAASLLKPDFILVTTPSKLSRETLCKNKTLLEETGMNVLLTIENLGKDIAVDPNLEKAFGNPRDILATSFSKDLRKVLERDLKGVFR